MNKERLFEYFKTQNQSKLLELLSLAFDTMDTNQRHDVFGKKAKEVPPSLVNGKEILTTIEQFYEKSMEGYYYAPFDINSKKQETGHILNIKYLQPIFNILDVTQDFSLSAAADVGR